MRPEVAAKLRIQGARVFELASLYIIRQRSGEKDMTLGAHSSNMPFG